MSRDIFHKNALTVSIFLFFFIIAFFAGSYSTKFLHTNDYTGNVVSQPGAGQQLVFLDFNQIQLRYGSRNFQYSKSGNELCQQFGYSGCLYQNHEFVIDYFSSTDGTCSSINSVTLKTGKELTLRYTLPFKCSDRGSGKTACHNSYVLQMPPGVGDTIIDSHLNSIVCIK